MPAREPTQPCSWHGRTRIAPSRMLASASSSLSASASKRAPPMTPVRCPPVYSFQASGAPDVRTVSRVIPGMTSIAGRTSTSTGSAAQIRATASAFARSRSAASASSGERLVIAPLQKLELLPLPVDRRVEALRVLCDPDLRSDHEVVRIEVESCAPELDRVVGAAGGVAADPAREELERFRGHPRFVIGRLGRLAGEEPPEVPGHTRIGDVEVIETAVADERVRVHEEAARHDPEPERGAERAGAVDEHRERDLSLLDDLPHALLALGVLCHSEQLEAPRTLVPRPLPHGQLLPARSPRSEAEDDRGPADEVGPRPHATPEIRQREIRKSVQEVCAHSIGITLKARSTLTP